MANGFYPHTLDGRSWSYEIMPLLYQRARIVLTDGGGVSDGW